MTNLSHEKIIKSEEIIQVDVQCLFIGNFNSLMIFHDIISKSFTMKGSGQVILHTEIVGEGVPLVLVHSGGMTSTAEYNGQSTFFSNRNYQVIRPDLRGHGKSVGETADYFSQSVEDVKETMDYLEIDQFHIAGVSIGGIVALLFTQKYPEKILSLCFSGVFPKKPNTWDKLLDEERKHFEQLSNDSEVSDVLDKMHGGNDWRELLRMFNGEDFYPFDRTGDVASLSVPTLYLVGEEQELEVSAAGTYKQLNPAIHIAVLPFSGHLVHREQPDLYSHTLLNFIEQYANEK